jgi:hypothetical protein
MRHTFFPIQEQKILKREYRLRAVAVAFFMLALAGLIGVISLFPSYIQVAMERSSQAGTLASLKKGPDARAADAYREELESDMKRLALLKDSTRVKPSTLIMETVSARGAVDITALSIDNISTTTATIIVQGIAPTRDALVSFKTRLEGLVMGNKVELPISELAKSKDIQFSLKYTTLLP